MPGANNIIEIFKLYNNGNWFLVLFVFALLYLLWRLDAQNRKNVLLLLAAAFLLIFNDFSYRIVSNIMDGETYYRFIWIIPVVPLLAYVIVDTFIRRKHLLCRIAVLVISCCLIWKGGTSCIDSESFHWPNHIVYLNQEAAPVCELILADTDQEFPRVACDVNLATSLRLCDARIVNYIEREIYRNPDTEPTVSAWRRQYYANRLVSGEKIKKKYTRRIIAKGELHYIVAATAFNLDRYMKKCGCTVLGRTNGYTVYKTNI